VGVAAACFALFALLMITGIQHRADELIVLVSLAVMGILTGTTSAIYASARERQRRLFLTDVDRGVTEGYRVTQATGQAVLVRVTRTREIYRGADLEEPLALLDESGDARRTFNAPPT
jgi:hypothetical protein